MDIILVPLFNLFNALLSLYFYILIASVIMSWLLAFGVVNTNNQVVSTLSEFLFRATEPALRPIRQRLPDFGGLDISPVILIFILYFVQGMLTRLMMRLFGVL